MYKSKETPFLCKSKDNSSNNSVPYPHINMCGDTLRNIPERGDEKFHEYGKL